MLHNINMIVLNVSYFRVETFTHLYPAIHFERCEKRKLAINERDRYDKKADEFPGGSLCWKKQ